MKFVLKKIELNKNKKLLLLLLLSIQNWKLIQKGNIFFLKFIVYETYFLFSFFFFKNLKRDRNLIDNFVSSCLEDWTSQKNPPIKFNLISIHCILFLFFFFTRNIESRKRKWAETFSLEYTSDVYQSRFLRISTPLLQW